MDTNEVVGYIFRYAILPGCSVALIAYCIKGLSSQVPKAVKSRSWQSIAWATTLVVFFLVGLIVMFDGWIGDLLGPQKGPTALTVLLVLFIWISRKAKK